MTFDKIVETLNGYLVISEKVEILASLPKLSIDELLIVQVTAESKLKHPGISQSALYREIYDAAKKMQNGKFDLQF